MTADLLKRAELLLKYKKLLRVSHGEADKHLDRFSKKRRGKLKENEQTPPGCGSPRVHIISLDPSSDVHQPCLIASQDKAKAACNISPNHCGEFLRSSTA